MKTRGLSVFRVINNLVLALFVVGASFSSSANDLLGVTAGVAAAHVAPIRSQGLALASGRVVRQRQEQVQLPTATQTLRIALPVPSADEIRSAVRREKNLIIDRVFLPLPPQTFDVSVTSDFVLLELVAAEASSIRIGVRPLLAKASISAQSLTADNIVLWDATWEALSQRVMQNPLGYPGGEVWLVPSKQGETVLRLLLRGSPNDIRAALTTLHGYEYAFDYQKVVRTLANDERSKSGFENCFSDVVCSANAYRLAARSATVKLSATTGTCSGTVISDSRQTGALYVLTASHCGYTTQAIANSVLVDWYYEISSCDPQSQLSRNYATSTYGLDLLYAGDPAAGGPDITLLRLRDVPGGMPIVAAPWAAYEPPSGVQVVGIHHAAALPKKASFGSTRSNTRCTFNGTGFSCEGSGSIFAYVDWSAMNALTAKGSSGSGLFDTAGVLYGVLSGGGSSSCSYGSSSPSTYGLYSLLNEAMSDMYPFLNPPQQPGSQNATVDAITSIVLSEVCSLDIDGNGRVDAATDGLLLLRALLGFSGPSLTAGAIGQVVGGVPLLRPDADSIKSFVDELASSGQLDIDGDGNANAMADGLIALRAILGITGPTALSGAVSPAILESWNTVSERLRANCGFSAQ